MHNSKKPENTEENDTMARSNRQSKILEIIQQNEIETQDELVNALRALNFDITQATISRDIKELGLIKIMSENKKYKYAYVDSTEQQMSSKYTSILKESVISIKSVNNLVVLKTLKGLSSAVSNMIDKMSIKQVMGCVYGDETVMVICDSNDSTLSVMDKLNQSMAI